MVDVVTKVDRTILSIRVFGLDLCLYSKALNRLNQGRVLNRSKSTWAPHHLVDNKQQTLLECVVLLVCAILMLNFQITGTLTKVVPKA